MSDGARALLLYRPATTGPAPRKSEGSVRARFLQGCTTQTRGAGCGLSLFSLGARPLRAPRSTSWFCAALPGGARSTRRCQSPLLRRRGLGVCALQLGGELLFLNKNKRPSGRAAGAPAPRGGHEGALPADACDLSPQTAPSASQGSRGDGVADYVCAGPAPAPPRGREYRAPGSSGGERLPGDPVLAGACFLSPLTKSCSPSATDRLSRLKQIKGRIPLFQGGREALSALTRFARFTGSG